MCIRDRNVTFAAKTKTAANMGSSDFFKSFAESKTETKAISEEVRIIMNDTKYGPMREEL